MNTEKAVDLLDNLIGMVDDNQGNDYDAAFRMAIDALKAQSDGDTINRKEAIDEVCKAGCGSGFCGVECDEVLALRNMSSAQPEKRTEERTKTHACDCISRQDAIRIVDGIDTRQAGWRGDAIESIKALPPTHPDLSEYSDKLWKAAYERGKAEAQQRWIPCSERLPKEDVEVLISYRYKEGEGDTSHTYIDITTYGQMYFGGNKVGNYKHWRAPFEYFESNYEVIAWMPLPEPYAERRTDE